MPTHDSRQQGGMMPGRLSPFICILLLLSPSFASAQQTDSLALRAEFQRLFDALGQGNSAYLADRHYVPEVSRIHLAGEVDKGWDDAKAKGVRDFMAQGWRFRVTSLSIQDLRIYGDIGIVAGVLDAVQQLPQQPDETLRIRFSYVWRKVDGRWVELHHHVSRA